MSASASDISSLAPEADSRLDSWPPSHVLAAGAGILLAAVLLQARPLWRPVLLYDDFQILARSWTGQLAWSNLWLPHNEHIMPLGRLSTALLVQFAGQQTWLPFLAALQGPAAIVAGMCLVGWFVRRELGHPWYGLAAMALFGISTQFSEAVWWFSASFSILALDTMLLALLAAQRWRQTGRLHHLVCCAVWAGLAPAWFASGILAGLFCSIYLLVRKPDRRLQVAAGRLQIERKDARGLSICNLPAATCNLLVCFAPLLGTAVFLAISLPRTADHIMHLQHYRGKSAVEVFDALQGLEFTGRALLDNLAIGEFGISGINCPPAGTIGGLTALLLAGLLWWWLATHRRLLVLGLAFIFVSYWLVYSARASWGYEIVSRWGRYQLLPHLGLVFFLCGGLPRWQDRLLWTSDSDCFWTSGRVLACLAALLFLIQLPRGLTTGPSTEATWARQQADLARIARVDARCRVHQIAAAAALRALEPFRVFWSSEEVNGWELLRGSEDPRPLEEDEARRLLEPEEDDKVTSCP